MSEVVFSRTALARQLVEELGVRLVARDGLAGGAAMMVLSVKPGQAGRTSSRQGLCVVVDPRSRATIRVDHVDGALARVVSEQSRDRGRAIREDCLDQTSRTALIRTLEGVGADIAGAMRADLDVLAPQDGAGLIEQAQTRMDRECYWQAALIYEVELATESLLLAERQSVGGAP